LFVPLITWAKPATSYQEVMKNQLNFSLVKNEQAYAELIARVRELERAGQPITLNLKLLEIRDLLVQASTSLASLTPEAKPWRETRQEIRAVVSDLRLVHAKIRKINKLVNKYGK